jgi:hypothetical protein
MGRGFKNQKTDSKIFNYNTDDVKIEVKNHKHPIFCFKYQHKDFDISKCTNDEKVSLLEQVGRLSQLTWEQITTTQRHGLGTEKINRDSLNVNCPAFITNDVKYLLAIRFQGKKPFLIHRDRFIAHVVFIDNKFSVYNH